MFEHEKEKKLLLNRYNKRDRRKTSVKTFHYAPAENFMEFEKTNAWQSSLSRHLTTKLHDNTVLDVGCGYGTWLRMLLELGADPDKLHGIDMLDDRIEIAKRRSPNAINFCKGSAWELPFVSECMDITTASTVFSSILSKEGRIKLAFEMQRVTKPRGFCMIYDFVVSSPGNPDTLGLSSKELKTLFSQSKLIEKKFLTLAPPLTRATYSWAPWLPPLLTALLPFLCTHRIFIYQRID